MFCVAWNFSCCAGKYSYFVLSSDIHASIHVDTLCYFVVKFPVVAGNYWDFNAFDANQWLPQYHRKAYFVRKILLNRDFVLCISTPLERSNEVVPSVFWYLGWNILWQRSVRIGCQRDENINFQLQIWATRHYTSVQMQMHISSRLLSMWTFDKNKYPIQLTNRVDFSSHISLVTISISCAVDRIKR